MEIELTKKQKALKISLLTTSIVLSVIAALLFYYSVFINNSNSVKISINGGEPLFNEEGIGLEPGSFVEKEFSIKNEGTFSIYYRIYLENLSGTLVDVAEVMISSGDIILFSGPVKELIKDNAKSLDNSLGSKKERTLKIRFSLPSGIEKEIENGRLKFDICADATKSYNNENRSF